MIKSVALFDSIKYLLLVMETFEKATVFTAYALMIAFALYVINALVISTL